MAEPLRLVTDQQSHLVNVEAEAALLGALMIDDRAYDRIADIVTRDDFSEDVHATIFAAIQSQAEAGLTTSPVTLMKLVETHPAFAQLGGTGYLFKLTGSGASLIGYRDFARQIADLARRRRLVADMRDMIARAEQLGETSIADIVQGVDVALHRTLERASNTRSATLAAAWDQAIAEIEAEAAGERTPAIRIKGVEDWNDLTGGMRPGEVTVLAARPAMGKTAMALAIGTGAARAGHGTLLVSLEMTMPELAKRAIADLVHDDGNGPSFEAVKAGNFTSYDRERLRLARREVETWPMMLTDPSQLKIGRLAMSIRRFQRSFAARDQKLELVVLDYLGLIKADDPRASRYQGVGEVSRAIKEVAKECGVHVLLLAQLNRECEKREDKRPQLSDLRDSGDIEQDADTVAFLYREAYYLKAAEPKPDDPKHVDWEIALGKCRDKLEIIVAKRRNGRTARRTVHFFEEHQAVRSSDYSSPGRRA